MIAFVDSNRDRRTVDGLVWGVEPICTTLQFAPQTFLRGEVTAAVGVGGP